MSRRTMADMHKYQWTMIDWVLNNPKCALWAGVGLGKTVVALSAINTLLLRKTINKVLIVAPLRVATNVWPSEINAWEHLKHLRSALIRGTPAQRKEQLNSSAEIHLINKELLPWLIDECSDRNEWPYDLTVLDDSSARNSKTKRFKSLRMVRPHMPRLVELNATPAPNGLLNLWGPMFLIDGGERLGRTMTSYKRAYFDADYMGFNFTLKPGASDDIYTAVQDRCLSLTSNDHLDLPPCNHNIIPLVMEPGVKEQYKELEREFVLELETGLITASQAAVLSNKLIQFCSGAVYTEPDIWTTVHNQKMEALKELVDEMAGQPLLIAYNYRHELDRLRSEFPSGRVLDTKQDEDDWNAGSVPLMFVHPQSCGHGLNLQYGGCNLVWYSLTWNLELFDQLIGRLDRQGQTKPVFVHMFIFDDTIEALMVRRLQDKSVTQDELLTAMKEEHKFKLNPELLATQPFI
jgi:SNF2 family DNA or RNA helicase